MDGQRMWFLEMEFTPGKDAVKIVKRTTKDLVYYINLADKATAGYERIHSNFVKVLLWVKCYQTVSHGTEKTFVKGSVCRCSKFHCYVKKLPQPPQPSAPTTLISQQPSTSGKTLTSKKIMTF